MILQMALQVALTSFSKYVGMLLKVLVSCFFWAF
jgi:hypothetical protein